MAPVLENTYCGLLSSEENLQIVKLLGNRCQSLCTTVVQLYLTKPPDHSQWFKKNSGVLCFVKDNIKKNFFFRLFCTQRNMKVWEQEMYNGMEYIEGTPFFHMFEGENCLVAFNFANVEEARDLRIVVHQKIHARKRREEKRCRQISQSQTLPSPTTHLDFSNFKKTLDPFAKQTKRKKGLITKKDIGIPRDFKHISHVGWNSTSGFDINTEDEQLKTFFKKAGVSEQQLQDKKTRDYIYNFINRNGGREVIEQTNESIQNHETPPAVPPRGPPTGHRSAHFRNAPPPPISGKTSNNLTPRKPRMEVPPPKKPAPIPNFGTTATSESAPAPPAPTPPPPPPPPIFDETDKDPKMGGGAPPPPPMAPVSMAGGGGNSAFLESIRNGTTLKPVEDRTPAPQEDTRGDLLSEIRKGCKLRPVDERDIKPVSNSPMSKSDDLACALARALAKRSEVIHSEDDDDMSDSTNSDWED